MARIRTIKPELFQSATLAKVSLAAERTFNGLLTQADDEGRLKDQPAVLNGALWPEREERDDHPTSAMRADLDALIEIGMLCRYESQPGRTHLHIPSFLEHQKINRPTKSKIPACPVHDAPPTTPSPAAVRPEQLALAEPVAA
jgi:hypothetical protein